MDFTEDELESAYIDILEGLGWEYKRGSEISEDERGSFHEVLLIEELRNAVYRINRGMPRDSLEEAIRKVRMLSNPSLIEANEEFHKMVTDGIDVSYRDKDNNDRFTKVKLFDLEEIENNTFTAINQFTIIGKTKRRPDIILFVNGIPLVVIELKSMINEDVGLEDSFIQIERYKLEIEELFKYNAFIILSDGATAKAGTISTNFERYMSFRSVDGEDIRPLDEMQMETITYAMLTKERILELMHDFILFMKSDKETIKILAQYHQFFAIKRALECTKVARGNEGRIGVIWHTQGSGKSLTMTFYTGQLMKKFKNPTIVVITDRNDLDDQLYETFSKCNSYLVERPKQADDKEELKKYLDVNSGGIIFTTIQKFAPTKDQELMDVISDREDIIVVADEAHRTQYGLHAKQTFDGKLKYGYAKHVRDALPKANFIGFTGTPIDAEDKSTIAVFGNYIDIYDMSRAVEDGSTVKIYYENRHIKLKLDDNQIIEIDEEAQEILENIEEIKAEKKKKEYTKMEAIIGSPSRVKDLAKDIVNHWEARKNIAKGKAMIVCTSRRICVELYKEIRLLKPEWHNEDRTKGKIKVIMTNSATDPLEWKEHFTTKKDRKELAERMRKADDELEIAIVRNMWLTGFDVPCMHTMYIDKVMSGHNLMQAIARVNRVFKDKNGGLVVDYLSIGENLKKALQQYSEPDRENTGIDIDRAIQMMTEYYEVVKDMIHGFDYSNYNSNIPLKRGKCIIGGMNYILGIDIEKEGYKKDFTTQVASLSKAHALCVTTEEGKALNEEVAYFKAIKASFGKVEQSKNSKLMSEAEINKKMANLLSNTIITEEVIDIYEELGIENPNLSILSDEFLEDIKKMEHKNLAVEMLKKLIEGKIKSVARKNVVQSEKFSDKLKKSLQSYRNKAITNLEVMEELIKMAKEFQEKIKEDDNLGLTRDEVAFYDALASDNVLEEMEDSETLKLIAKELTEYIRNNKGVDWHIKKSAQAAMRSKIKRLLDKYDYPPKEKKRALETVLKQANLMCENME